MRWELRYSKKAEKQLSKLDPSVSTLIVSWMKKNVKWCLDPRAHGKGLTDDRVGQWRYRVGNYRVLCEIKDAELMVLAIEIEHRSKVYRSR